MPVHPQWILLTALCCFCMIKTVQPRPETILFPDQLKGLRKAANGLYKESPPRQLIDRFKTSPWQTYKSSRRVNGLAQSFTKPKGNPRIIFLNENTYKRGQNTDRDKEHNDTDRIVFREKANITTVQPGKDYSTPKNDGKRPKCASKGSSYCLEDESYPKEHVQNLLQNLKTKNRLLYDLATKKDELDLGLQDRLKEDEYTLCESKEEVVSITRAQNKKGEWLFVVTDGIRIETCISNSNCSSFIEVAGNMATTCVQKYAYRQVPYLTKNSSDMDLGDFRIPTCCSCQLQDRGNVFHSRMGLLKQNISPASSRLNVTH